MTFKHLLWVYHSDLLVIELHVMCCLKTLFPYRIQQAHNRPGLLDIL